MNRALVKRLVIAALVCGGCGACSRSRHDQHAEAPGLDPDRWRPTAEAIAAAKRDKKAPLIVARATQPRASAYDLNPRAAAGQVQADQSANPASDSPPNEQAAEADPMFGGMEKLPVPPMPKLGPGDEADQFGLPEWERMARGELQVKRIHY